MNPGRKFDRSRWMLTRERLRLTEPRPPRPEPDLSLRTAIRGLFAKLDSQTGSAVQQIQSKWKLIAGEIVAQHSRPGRLNENILYIYVESSAWLAEITRFHADDIRRKIQSSLPPGTVRAVRFQVNPPQAHAGAPHQDDNLP